MPCFTMRNAFCFSNTSILAPVCGDPTVKLYLPFRTDWGYASFGKPAMVKHHCPLCPNGVWLLRSLSLGGMQFALKIRWKQTHYICQTNPSGIGNAPSGPFVKSDAGEDSTSPWTSAEGAAELGSWMECWMATTAWSKSQKTSWGIPV